MSPCLGVGGVIMSLVYDIWAFHLVNTVLIQDSVKVKIRENYFASHLHENRNKDK